MSFLDKVKSWLHTDNVALHENTPPQTTENNTPETIEAKTENVVETEHSVPDETDETKVENQIETENPAPQVENHHNLTNLNKETDFCGLILERTLQAHRSWYNNLESALRGQYPTIYEAKKMSDDRIGELGKWLYDNEKVFASYPEYTVLVALHKSFHHCAGEVLEHHRRGRFADAILLLRRDLSLLSDEVQKALIALHQQAQKNGSNMCGG